MKLFIIYHSLITYIHLTLFFYISSNFYLRSGKYLFKNTKTIQLMINCSCAAPIRAFFLCESFLNFIGFSIGFSKFIIHSSVSHIPKYKCAYFNVFSNETVYMTSLNTFGKVQQIIKD
mgnify:CR=1 FL=1